MAVTKSAPEKVAEVDEKEELTKKVSEILKEHGGTESNIPMNSEYWSLLGQLRALK